MFISTLISVAWQQPRQAQGICYRANPHQGLKIRAGQQKKSEVVDPAEFQRIQKILIKICLVRERNMIFLKKSKFGRIRQDLVEFTDNSVTRIPDALNEKSTKFCQKIDHLKKINYRKIWLTSTKFIHQNYTQYISIIHNT
jgi:hypothetical protein